MMKNNANNNCTYGELVVFLLLLLLFTSHAIMTAAMHMKATEPRTAASRLVLIPRRGRRGLLGPPLSRFVSKFGTVLLLDAVIMFCIRLILASLSKIMLLGLFKTVAD